MARVRFPGRPGHRVDQIRVTCHKDDIKNPHDTSLGFLPQFRQGLRSFRELVGTSDEDDEFEGFSAKEIRDSEKRLRECQKRQEEERRAEEEEEEEERQYEAVGFETRFYRKEENIPTSKRARNKLKAVVKKSYEDMLNEGFRSPGNSHCVVSMTPLQGKSKLDSGGKGRSRNPKMSKKVECPMENQGQAAQVKVKKTEKDMAKFLLEKAKQANLLQQQAKARRLAAAASSKVVQRRKFVLPTQSSRSSRVIIPNKRFLEDDSVTSPVLKKRKSLDSNPNEEQEPVFEGTPFKSDGTMASPFKTSFVIDRPKGSLDQPLIVDGKRDRKPSVKILEKIVDNSEKEFHSFKTLTSPIAAPKLGKSLFPSSSGPPVTFQKASESQKFGMFGFGSARKQGASIVQKAKLQLNRAALNKSSAALAWSLKAEMKREAKLAEIEKQTQSELAYGGIIAKAEQEKQVGPRKRPCCVICGYKGKALKKHGRGELSWSYKKYYACQACLGFYARSRSRAKKNIRYTCDGGDPGKCQLSHKSRSCKLCRIIKCIELEFPHAELLSRLVRKRKQAKTQIEGVVKGKEQSPRGESVSKKEVTQVKKSSIKWEEQVQPESSVRVQNTEDQFSVHKYTIGTGSVITRRQEGTGDELSPLKDTTEHRRRRKVSKDTLKSPDKGKPPDPQPEPELSTSLTTPVEGTEEASPQSSSHGPRIKHVCRNAAVVLGKTPATFPEKSEFRLSALPKKDKVEIWKQDEEVKAAATADSDDDRPIEEIIEKSANTSSIIVKKPHPEQKEKQLKKLIGPGGLKMYKRKMRCRQCPGCLATDCGKCRHCLDKPKFGGPGTSKQACAYRRCERPLIQRSATAAFIKPKTTTAESGTDSNTDSVHNSPEKSKRISRQIERPREIVEDTEIEKSPKISVSVPISSNESDCKTLDDRSEMACESEDQRKNQCGTSPVTNLNNITVTRVDLPVKNQRTEVRKLKFDSGQDIQLEHLPSKRFGKIRSKIQKKIEVQKKYSKNTSDNNQCYPVTLVDPASRQWGSAVSQPKYHPIKVDYKSKYNVNVAWSYGIALTMSSAMNVRTLCFLCGSSGKLELVFCNVCCEPFHKFCLEEFEQPSKGHDADWCCARCQFCSVCGRQNNLLQCDKCQNMYHPECLGPNYPTKPTKEKKIWICTKCVKCKSCGATTPGTTSDATWTYDFSLCYECGKLMDKGNFCPICHKCYSDDDWESKMVQCNNCESWVHSKCEGLTDEMYEILSCLPEDLSFYCQRCSPKGCPEWMKTLRQELRLGLENIMQTLILSKCAQYIIKQEHKIMAQKQICDTDIDSINQASSVRDSEQESKKETSNITEIRDNEQLVAERKTDLFIKDSGSLVRKNNGSIHHSDIITSVSNVSDPNLGDKSETLSGSSRTSVLCTKGNKVSGHDDTTSTAAGSAISLCRGSYDQGTDGTNCIGQQNGSYKNNQSGTNSEVGNTEMVTDIDAGVKICDNVNKKKELVSALAGSTFLGNKHCEAGVNRGVSDLYVFVSGKKIDSDVTKSSDKSDSDSNCAGKPLNHNEIKAVGDELLDKNKDNREFPSHKQISENALIVSDSAKLEREEITSYLTTTKEIKKVSEKHHVQFNMADNKVVEASELLEQDDEPEYPRDLMEIAEKMKTGFYKSVAIFCEDILRIIQEYLDNDAETRVTRKKSIQAAKGIFVKQMEKIFPWFKVKQCRYWYSSKNIPDLEESKICKMGRVKPCPDDTKHSGMLPDATLPPTIDHTYAQWLLRTELPNSPQPSPFKRTQTPVKKYVHYDEEDEEVRTFMAGDDTRRCMFCLQYGDQDCNDAGRLLYCGQDDWSHINCALWSAEVYEDDYGGLQNLVEAYSRGKMLKCDLCGLSGATVGCNTRGCKSNYHFMCAREDRCKFQEDKKVFCKYHTLDVDGELLERNKFSVLRRVYVDCLNVRTVKKHWSKGLNVTEVNVVIGSCSVDCLGRLTDLSDKRRFLQPVDFLSTRIYWSTKDARKRCVYTCRIVEVRPEMSKSPTIEIKDTRIVHDDSHPDFVPFSELDLNSLNLGHLKPTRTAVKSFVVDLTLEESVDSARTLSAIPEETSCHSEMSQPSHFSPCSHHYDVENTIGERSFVRSESFSESAANKDVNKSDKLSVSWNGFEKRKVQSQVSFRGLSPKTLQLLNIKDPSKHTLSMGDQGCDVNDDLALVKIANRLNNAAAKASKQTTGSGTQILGQQRNRSKSVDSCSHGKFGLENQKKPLLSSPPSIPWSPPYRMSMRANSWPKESKPLSLLASSNDKQPFITKAGLEQINELTDIHPMSEPIGSSSPKLSQGKYHSKVSEMGDVGKIEPSVESPSCSELDSQTGCVEGVLDLQVEGNSDEFAETTFVVMTDTSEELSEEEAIKIVQEVLSGNNKLENTNQSLTTDTSNVDEVNNGTNTDDLLTFKKDAIKLDKDESEMTDKNTDKRGESGGTGLTDKPGLVSSVRHSPGVIGSMIDIPEGVASDTGCAVDLTDDTEETNDDVRMTCDIKNSTDGNTETADKNNQNTKNDKVLISDSESVLKTGTKLLSDKELITEQLGNQPQMNETSERSDSPFIPQFVCDNCSPGLLSMSHNRDRHDNEGMESNTTACVKEQTDTKLRNTFDHIYVCDNGDSDSDVLDITDSINKSNAEKANDVKVDKVFGTTDDTFKYAEKRLEIQKKAVENRDRENQDTVDVDDTKLSPERDKLIQDTVTNKDEVDGDQTDNLSDHKAIDAEKLINTNPVAQNSRTDQTISDSTCHTVFKSTTECEDVNEKVNKCVVMEADEHCMLHNQHGSEIDPQKKQVLRELGLGTSDEVEQIKKNSPTKNLSCLNAFTGFECMKTRKQKRSPRLLKKYPLRRKTGLLSRYPNMDGSSSSLIDEKSQNHLSVENLEQKDRTVNGENIEKKDETITKESIEKKPELPVLDPIAKKIKEESLAKSIPEEKGPFKCQTCRRLYRTETSYQIHIKNCTFYVSSSDEEDDSEGSKSQPEQTVTGRSLRSKSKLKLDTEKNESDVVKSKKQRKDSESKLKSQEVDRVESVPRTSLRQSTIFQRVAIEVEERRLKEEALKLTSPKRRGRKPLKMKLDEQEKKQEMQKLSKDIDYRRSDMRKVGRKSDHSETRDSKGCSSEKIIKKTLTEQNEDECCNDNLVSDDILTSSESRIKGNRRDKEGLSESETEPTCPKQIKLGGFLSPNKKRRTRSSGPVVDTKCSSEPKLEQDLVTENNHNKRRGRPSLYSDRSRENNAHGTNKVHLTDKVGDSDNDDDTKVTSDDEEIGTVDGKNSSPASCKKSLKLTKNKASETSPDSSVETDSDERNEPVLDHVSGLIIDPKTGLMHSPEKLQTKNGLPEEVQKSVEMTNVVGRSESSTITEDENRNCLNTNMKDTDLDCAGAKDIASANDNLNTLSASHKDLKKDSIIKSESYVLKKEESCEMELTSDCLDKIERNPVEQASKGGAENGNTILSSGNTMNLAQSSDLSKSSLSRTVLELLKNGHKVVIKNPALDKNYVWEKTESGYVGKPLDKNMHYSNKLVLSANVSAQDIVKKVPGNETRDYTVSDQSNIDSAGNNENEICLEKSKPNTASEILAEKKLQEKRVKDKQQQSCGPGAASWTSQKVEQSKLGKKEQKTQDNKVAVPKQHASENKAILPTSTVLENRPIVPTGTVQENRQILPASFVMENGPILPTGTVPENGQLLPASTVQENRPYLPTGIVPENRPILPPGAEYVGGFVVSGRGANNSDTLRKLQNTAELATSALQNSLQLKNTFVGANLSKVFQQEGQTQSLVQFLNVNSSSYTNPVITYPLLLQNTLPSALAQLQTNLPPTNLGTLLSTSTSYNSLFNQHPITGSFIHQSGQNVSNLNSEAKEQSEKPNILRKPSDDKPKLKSLLKPRKPVTEAHSYLHSSPNRLESLRHYLSKKNLLSGKGFQNSLATQTSNTPYHGTKKVVKDQSWLTDLKPVIVPVKNLDTKSSLKDHLMKTKMHKRKRLQRKLSIKPRSPVKGASIKSRSPVKGVGGRRRSTIAVPHTSAKASHPIIHPQKENYQLPVAAVEEEVRDIPLSTMLELENRGHGSDKGGQSRGYLEYEITSDDGFSCKADTLDGAWKQVIEKVQDARVANRFKQLSYTGLSGIEMFGLSHPNVVYLLEQLSGAGYCRQYKFKYHKHEPTEQEVELINPSGCIRSEPFSGRNPWDMFSFLMSRYRQMPEKSYQVGDEEMAQKSSRRATSMDLPMAMRFRKLKAFSRECVGVYRSSIHGRGLFCKRNIDAGEMIIEYAGEVIRNSMTDFREKYYESKGIGCYMFRIDDKDVVDATMKGSAARFINHSCEPNCYSKVITVDNRKHIVIFAMRQILRGEELTYDYKFPIEEVKIPCTCGSSRCRKYLN